MTTVVVVVQTKWMTYWLARLLSHSTTRSHDSRNNNFFFPPPHHTSCSQTGLSPLAPGQWKGFLAVYAGFFVFNNFVRPLRFTAAVAVSPQLDRLVAALQRRLRIRKGAAVALTVFLLNVVGTLCFMGSGIAVAALAAGVPVFPPK